MLIRDVRKKRVLGKYNIVLEGQKIEQVKETKYLGVIIDEHLSFTSHAYYIARKISKKTSYLYRIGGFISNYTKVLIYKAIIAPHYEYCSSLLINLNKDCINMLQKTQNRVMRIILRVNKYTSVKKMLKALCFMSVEERIKYNVCVFVHKMIKDITPSYLSNIVYTRRHEYETRNRNNLVTLRKKTKTAEKTINSYGFSLYNKLSLQTQTAERISQFNPSSLAQ